MTALSGAQCRYDHRFELLATLGPASLHLTSRLAEAGATGFRLNASHFDPETLRQTILLARGHAPAVPIVVDLQGAKMRLGRFVDRPVEAGERVVFSAAGADEDAVPLPHAELYAQARPGEILRVDDARLEFEIVKVSPERLETRALAAGRLAQRKGVNVRDHPIELQDLGAHDQEVLRGLGDCGPLDWALSFMNDGSEALWLRRRLGECIVIGKVERREALDRLADVAQAVDVLWLCRGDLGAQIGPIDLGRRVAALDPHRVSRPVLMAGQVLEHLTSHSQPTRSEVCHLHDLLSRGYAGIVLSDETAIGVDPERAVRTATELMVGFTGGWTTGV